MFDLTEFAPAVNLPSTWQTDASAPSFTSLCNHTTCLLERRSPGPSLPQSEDTILNVPETRN